MARTKISEFSATAASNTDIDSINIAEGCAPSGINDAIRELMSQLKDFQTGAVGDSFNGPVGTTTAAAGAFTTLSASSTLAVTGVATLTAQPILSSLTASRAVFTDASKGLVSNAITGTGNVVMSTSPTLVTPTLGVATATSLQGIIGNVTPAAGTFTTVTGSNDASLNGLTVGRGAGAVSSNTAVGASALAANTSGSVNVAVGSSALLNNTSGAALVAVGSQALRANTTGSDNTVVGRDAGLANTTGNSLSALGQEALLSNTTGSNSVAIGSQALRYNTTASNNTAVGYQAVYSNVTGGGLCAVGYKALYASTGNYNHAFGNQAGLAITSGTSNLMMGINAGFGTTTGSYNTFVGCVDASLTAVGGSNTTGSYNVAMGNGALYSNNTASYNTAVGYQAGYTSTTATNNTLIGAVAGTALTGGGNTFIGAGVGQLVTSGTKNTIIGTYNGNQGGLDIRTASNYIVLSDGDGNPRGYWNGANATFGGGLALSSTFSIFSTSPSSTSPGWKTQLGGNQTYTQISHGTQTSTAEYFYFINGNGTVGSIASSGSSTSYNTSSDYRLKNTIAPMTGALAKVALLKPCTYKWNADGSDGEGFIAHELSSVCPQAVTGTKDGLDADGNPKYQAIDVSFLVATLTAAIQELKAEFDVYKASHP